MMFDFIDYDAPLGEYQPSSGPNIPDAMDCMRCGQCLNSCPTYQLTKDEQEGPRQRIRTLSRLLIENQEVSPEDLQHLQNCTQCRACESVCPSQMDYAELFDQAQSQIKEGQQRGIYARLALFFIANKKALNAILPVVKLYQVSGLRGLLRRLNLLQRLGLSRVDKIAPTPTLNALKPCYPVSSAKGSVALFTGCVSDRFDRETLLAAIKVLNHIGYTVLVPRRQNCCGAIHNHNGDRKTAEALVRNNIELFAGLSVDAVIYCATGCGSQLLESPHWLEDESTEVTEFAGKLMEISEFVDLNWPDDLALKASQDKVLVHEPCSQRNVLRNQASVYRLLQRAPEMTVAELAENHLCCGAGGSYMLTHPDNADALRNRKWSHLKEGGADALVTANIGCALHLADEDASHKTVRIVHPITLIAERIG